MFLLKTLTVVTITIVATFIYFCNKNKFKANQNNGKLIIKNLSYHYHKLKLHMLESAGTKGKIKNELQKHKTLLAAKKKEIHKKNVYVIQFNGNIKATAVDSLKKEITAILLIANKKDNIILILESAGGTVSGYGLAASELARIKKKNIKLTVIVDKIAASGGYMMACIANEILAAPFAIIGSIGVISQTPNFNQLLKKQGIKYEQITSGQYKRTLTMFGNNKDKDRKKMKEELEAIHIQFKNLIKKQRPNVDINIISTGEYWLAEKSKKLQLVDQLITSDEYLMALYETVNNIYYVEYKKKLTFVNKVSMLSQYVKEFFNIKEV